MSVILVKYRSILETEKHELMSKEDFKLWNPIDLDVVVSITTILPGHLDIELMDDGEYEEVVVEDTTEGRYRILKSTYGENVSYMAQERTHMDVWIDRFYACLTLKEAKRNLRDWHKEEANRRDPTMTETEIDQRRKSTLFNKKK